MSTRKTEEDYLNTHRVFYRMIRDYAEGRLDKGRILYRAVVIDVDTKGGMLEARPPNPPNSVRARVYTKGLDATTPDEALTVFYPFLPAHMSPPVDINEHVYVMFEDEDKTNGVWLTTVPAFRDLNYNDPQQSLNKNVELKTSNVFEGTKPSKPITNSFDEEFGGVSTETSNRKKIVGVFSTQSVSFFKDKKVLLIGDSLMYNNLGSTLESALVQRGAKSVDKDLRKGTTIYQFSVGKRYKLTQTKSIEESIDDFSPDIILVSLGTDDVSSDVSIEETENSFVEVLNQISSKFPNMENVFFLSQLEAYPKTTLSKAKTEGVLNIQKKYIEKNLIDIRNISSESLQKDRTLTPQGAKQASDSILNIIEQRYI